MGVILEMPPLVHIALARNTIPAVSQEESGQIHVFDEDPEVLIADTMLRYLLRYYAKWPDDTEIDCPTGLMPGEVAHTRLVRDVVGGAQSIAEHAERVAARSSQNLGAYPGK